MGTRPHRTQPHRHVPTRRGATGGPFALRALRSKQQMTLPENLPYPIVFGPSFPDFTMVTKGGRQYFSSRRNQNLYLGDQDFTEGGTFTMARLLKLTATSSEECWPLLWGEVYFHEGEVIDFDGFLPEPNWDESEAFTRLLGYSQTEHEKHFFREWCRSQYRRHLEDAYLAWRDNVESSWHDRGFKRFAQDLLDVVFDFPALIPETWLNALGQEKTEADVRHLAENPSRVDFVVFAKSRKYVIEIDGPSHYADWDGEKYTINQELYAKNLAIERSLRRQGWDIHRFANVEVERASDDDFVRLLHGAQLPGFFEADDIWWPGLNPPYRKVTVEALEEALKWHVTKSQR